MMERLNEICGNFWTQFHKMLDDIEEAGFPVEYATEEYIEISASEDEDAPHFLLYIGQTGNTMWVTKVVSL